MVRNVGTSTAVRLFCGIGESAVCRLLRRGRLLEADDDLAVAAVAAPGVMSGVLMASLGFVESIFGFNADQIAVMMTFYMALDGYGPAANVTGDGAIALVADRYFGGGSK